RSPMLRLASLLAPVFVILGISTQAAANDSEYGTAFGTATDQGTSVQADAPAAGTTDELTALRNLTSFPVRVRLGNEDASKGWADPAQRAYQPRPASRHFKAANCEFYIKTGEFTLRRYEKEGASGEESLVVSKDPIVRFS